MKLESFLQKQVINYLVDKGWHVIRINSGSYSVEDKKRRYIAFYKQFSIYFDTMGVNAKKIYSSAGMVDLIAMKNNVALQIEVKQPSGKQNMAQKTYEQITTKHGNDYYIIRDIQELRDLLNSRQVQSQIAYK